MQPAFVYFFGSVQPYSVYFASWLDNFCLWRRLVACWLIGDKGLIVLKLGFAKWSEAYHTLIVEYNLG